MKYLIGVDVGSGSVRAGLFDTTGNMLAHESRKIQVWRETGDIVEQSSNDIWQAVCHCVRQVVQLAKVQPENVAGLGFDATCSLVVLGENGVPLPVSSDNPERNIIVWMDHRATEQAERINLGNHAVLKYVGGRISSEMETPKILWLKENRPEIYQKTEQFFDLTDFLTWKATGDLARSVCTVTCKWTYLAHEKRWDADYFRAIGLNELADENFVRIGQNIVDAGTALGKGLTAQAAQELGLPENTPVGAGLIDAHAGGIGTVGVAGGALASLGYVFGTSSCTMTTTREATFVDGVWGPYFSAMVPQMWLNEGGQSASGAAIDRLVAGHPAFQAACKLAEQANKPLPVYLADEVLARYTVAEAVQAACGLHVVPEFLGNRAPFADPNARAVIAGLGMETDFEDLLKWYVAGLCGVAYGLRQIVDAQRAVGIDTQNIVVSGGAGSHDLVRQILADATGLPVIGTAASEPVLLGSAILGAVAGGVCDNVETAMAQMNRIDREYTPNPEQQNLHEKRYLAYQKLQQVAREVRDLNA